MKEELNPNSIVFDDFYMIPKRVKQIYKGLEKEQRAIVDQSLGRFIKKGDFNKIWEFMEVLDEEKRERRTKSEVGKLSQLQFVQDYKADDSFIRDKKPIKMEKIKQRIEEEQGILELLPYWREFVEIDSKAEKFRFPDEFSKKEVIRDIQEIDPYFS